MSDQPLADTARLEAVVSWVAQLGRNARTVNDGHGEPLALKCDEAEAAIRTALTALSARQQAQAPCSLCSFDAEARVQQLTEERDEANAAYEEAASMLSSVNDSLCAAEARAQQTARDQVAAGWDEGVRFAGELGRRVIPSSEARDACIDRVLVMLGSEPTEPDESRQQTARATCPACHSPNVSFVCGDCDTRMMAADDDAPPIPTYPRRRCPEIHPTSGNRCTREDGHKGSHWGAYVVPGTDRKKPQAHDPACTTEGPHSGPCGEQEPIRETR